MKTTFLSSLVPFVLVTAPAAHAALVSVGWNYQGVGGVGLAPDDLAGAPGYVQANWNNHAGEGQGPGAVPLVLNDHTGAPTTLQVTGWTLVTNNSWQHGQSANPDEILMNDFSTTQPRLIFSDIPFSIYNVVVYYGNNEGPSTSTLTLGAQSRTITTGNTALSSYGEVGYLESVDEETPTPSNYAVFTGLTESSFEVSLTGINNNGFSAIQIVAIPEPMSSTLFGFASVMALLKRRR